MFEECFHHVMMFRSREWWQNQNNTRCDEHELACNTLHVLTFSIFYLLTIQCTHPSQWIFLCLWMNKSLAFPPTLSLKNWFWPLKNKSNEGEPKLALNKSVPQKVMRVALQLTVLLKLRTSLILFTYKESNSRDHTKIQKMQKINTP